MTSLGRKLADRIAAQLALLRARRLLAKTPVGTLTQRRTEDRVAALAAQATKCVEPVRLLRAEAIADAVRWSATHGLFRPFCLARSIALQELLLRAGIRGSEIRVGVRRNGDALEAHAWVTWNGGVLGDDAEHVHGFTEVDDLGVLGLR